MITFVEETKKPTEREYAANTTDIFLNSFVFGVGNAGKAVAAWSHPNPDEILRYESRGRFYLMYQHMEDTDPHYFSVLDTRKNALLGKSWIVTPSERDPRGEEHADFVTLALKMIPNLNEGLYEILDALGKGFKVTEIIWETKPVVMENGASEQRTLIKEMKGRPQRRFVFTLDGKLRLLTPEEQYSQGMVFSTSPMGVAVPPRKFVTAVFGKKDDNPYGCGLAKKCYWYYWFKKSLIKYAMVFADKFGMPTITGKYQAGLAPEKRQELINMLQNIQQEAVAIFPEGTDVELMEAQRTGTVQIYKDLTDFFDDAISKAVLGQTLTSTEGRRSGSLALGEVHADVKQDILEKDASWFAAILNQTIIRWLVEFNFANVLDFPKIKFQVEKTESQSERSTVLSSLKNMGMPLALHQVREEFKVEEPTDEEDTLPGGFGALPGGERGGEQPGEPPGGKPFGKPSAKKPGGGPQPAGGKAPEKKAEEGKGGEKKFAETKHPRKQLLDNFLSGSVGSAINAHRPILRAIRQLLKKKLSM